jgi:hypothetical protein
MKFDFKSVLTRNLLPGMSGSAGGDPTARGRGTPFTFYHARDTKEVFFSDAEGNLINLGSLIASVLDGSTPLAFPAQGCAGRDGARRAVTEPMENQAAMGRIRLCPARHRPSPARRVLRDKAFAANKAPPDLILPPFSPRCVRRWLNCAVRLHP